MRNLFMRNTIAASITCVLMLAACRTSAVETATLEGTDREIVPPTAEALPVGTTFDVRLNETLGTDVSSVGETFTATVTRDLTAANGMVAIPAGATIHGTITGLDPSEHLGYQAAIRLDFTRMEAGGQSYDFFAEVVDADVEETGGRDLDPTSRETAIGAGAGAVLGAIVGDDLLDILIGGALGAGVGTVISLGMGEVDARIPEGSTMTLRTSQRINL